VLASAELIVQGFLMQVLHGYAQCWLEWCDEPHCQFIFLLYWMAMAIELLASSYLWLDDCYTII
jgi:hypothetical protein